MIRGLYFFGFDTRDHIILNLNHFFGLDTLVQFFQ